MLRRLREFFIEKHGVDGTDRVLPSYEIEWLAERTGSPTSDITPLFAAGGLVPPAPAPIPKPKKGAIVH